MLRYLTLRLGEGVLLVALISFVVYCLIGLMPGDPIDLIAAGNPDFTPADRARLRAYYRLDDPLPARWAQWAVDALRGDFGFSREFNVPVMQVIGPALTNSLILVGLSVALALAIAVPLAVMAAARQGRWPDSLVNLSAFAGFSIPPFYLAILLMLLFAVQLNWVQATGMGLDRIAEDPYAPIKQALLPLLVLTVSGIGVYVRFLRGALIEELGQDYVRTARATGASRRRVLWRHALPNALLPLITIVALSLGSLFSGALVTEQVFGWRGMGLEMFNAINNSDFNVALVALLIVTSAIVVANLLGDLAYTLLDPRVRLGAGL